MSGESCGTHDGTPLWLNKEICGMICGCMTYLLLIFGMYATTFRVIIPWLGFSWAGIINIVAFNSCALLGCYSHFRAMTTDPGAVPKNAQPLEDELIQEQEAVEAGRLTKQTQQPFCKRCNAFKPRRAHHCSICRRCIVKMDHHCPWVNNCVGVGNHKLFMLFCFYVFATSTYSLLLTCGKIISCMMNQDHCILMDPLGVHEDAALSLMTVFLFIEGVLFGLFTCCMLGDQMTGIWSNQTAIDRLKRVKHRMQTELNEVCGTPSTMRFSWSWLIPTPAVFGRGVTYETIMGFQVPSAAATAAACVHSPFSDGSSSSSSSSNININTKNNSEERSADIGANVNVNVNGPNDAEDEENNRDSTYNREELELVPLMSSGSSGSRALDGTFIRSGGGSSSSTSGSSGIGGVSIGQNRGTGLSAAILSSASNSSTPVKNALSTTYISTAAATATTTGDDGKRKHN